jgi:4-amino-4-deoxy-L-arabinose transferase-like glycosyltransferase
VLAAFCAFLFFFGLASFGLVGADEPRYAQIAREMLARHDWVTPVLNGVPWLEKPALYYWAAMLSYQAFGVSDWAARVPSALLATAMVFAIYGFIRRLRPGAQLDAALMTASSAAVIAFARGASTDMPLAATFTIAMLAWWRWRDTDRRRWLAAFYFFMALGTLAKGPVAALLAALIIVAFAALRRDLRLIPRTLWWPGILLFLAVTLPWYVAVQRATGNFFRVFIIEHNLSRFGTDLYRHQQPFWYYLPVLLASVLPWVVMTLAGVLEAVRNLWPRANARSLDSDAACAPKPGALTAAASLGMTQDSAAASLGMTPEEDLRIFLLLWALLPVIFFSLSQSKLPGYILPSIPACTLLAADWMWRRAQSDVRAPWWMAVLHSAVSALMLGAVLLGPHALLKTKPPAASIATAAVAAGVIFLAMIASLRTRGLAVARFVTLVPVVLAVAFIVRVAAPIVDATQSARPIARAIAKLEYPSSSPVLAFAVKRETEFGLPFYRDATVIRYEGGALPFRPALIVTRKDSAAPLLAAVPPGTVLTLVGQVQAQGIEFYMASSSPKAQ